VLLEQMTLPVTHPTGEYDVVVGFDILRSLRERLSDVESVAIITDENVAPLYGPVLKKQWPNGVLITVPAGEAYKTLDTVRTIYDQMFAAGLDRKAVVISVGGGVINDMSGFVAASYMRGIRFVTCPTTLLSMVDASVGGKTGVDMPQGKNLIGAFKQPELVLADLSTLKTLPARELSCGMAEIIKHGVINAPELLTDVKIYDWHEIIYGEDSNRRPLLELVTNAIQVKRDVVQEDPFEDGRRALLNLGHTFGHAIEQVSEFGVPHGEGVGMGLVCAAHLSAALGYCPPDMQQLLESTLRHVRLPLRIPAGMDGEELVEAMQTDKKKMDGKLRFILIRQLGEAFIDGDVPLGKVMETLRAVTADE